LSFNPSAQVVEMQSVEEFLAYAIKLEQEAATRFGQLADAMEASGNREVGKLFQRLAHASRLHLAEARARSGFRDIPKMKPEEYVWPDLESPEAAAIWGADPLIGREQALEIALAAETAGLEYYKAVLDGSDDPEIKVLAKQFVEEEKGHVIALQKSIAAHRAGRS
jgi:rubrerythrin